MEEKICSYFCFVALKEIIIGLLTLRANLCASVLINFFF